MGVLATAPLKGAPISLPRILLKGQLQGKYATYPTLALTHNAIAEKLLQSAQARMDGVKTYRTCKEAKQEVFDYIEMFYNPKPKHAKNGMLSPAEFERRQMMRREGA